MTEHNIFQEIEADLERQRYEELWKKYGAWLLAFAAVVVLSTAVTSWWRQSHADANQRATVALFDIMEKYGQSPDPAHEMGDMEKFALRSGGSVQHLLAKLDAAGLAVTNGNVDRAVQLYDELAADESADTAFRQFAALMAVRAQLDSGDPAQLEKRLEPLLTDDVPWHFTALEYEGFVALRAGETDKARKAFTQLSQDARVPQTLSRRAADMLHYLSE